MRKILLDRFQQPGPKSVFQIQHVDSTLNHYPGPASCPDKREPLVASGTFPDSLDCTTQGSIKDRALRTQLRLVKRLFPTSDGCYLQAVELMFYDRSITKCNSHPLSLLMGVSHARLPPWGILSLPCVTSATSRARCGKPTPIQSRYIVEICRLCVSALQDPGARSTFISQVSPHVLPVRDIYSWMFTVNLLSA